MGKIRFAVAGTGWRSLFYVRAAKWFPDLFELTGVLCRTKDRARKYAGEHGVKTFHVLDALLETQPEFVVSCVNKAGMADMIISLLERGVNVLSETPYAVDEETLERVIAAQRESGAMLDLAEQYFLYPSHQARLAVVREGLLGEVTSCSMSMMHDYHGLSMLRAYLGETQMPAKMAACRLVSPIVVTGDRSGYLTDGEMGDEVRTLAQLTYEDGKTGLYDFAGSQYHSAIRSSHMRVLGTRGELFDDAVRWLTKDNRPMCESLVYHRDLITGTIASIDFAGKCVFANPFSTDVPMSEDDIAVGLVLLRMGRALEGGERHYPLEWGVEDARLSMELDRLRMGR